MEGVENAMHIRAHTFLELHTCIYLFPSPECLSSHSSYGQSRVIIYKCMLKQVLYIPMSLKPLSVDACMQV